MRAGYVLVLTGKFVRNAGERGKVTLQTNIHLHYEFCRWVDNIEMDFRETGWDVMDWIELDRNRDQRRAFVNTVMNLRVL
jgi:hypothetical protein